MDKDTGRSYVRCMAHMYSHGELCGMGAHVHVVRIWVCVYVLCCLSARLTD